MWFSAENVANNGALLMAYVPFITYTINSANDRQLFSPLNYWHIFRCKVGVPQAAQLNTVILDIDRPIAHCTEFRNKI